jgi:hypothetical protein
LIRHSATMLKHANFKLDRHVWWRRIDRQLADPRRFSRLRSTRSTKECSRRFLPKYGRSPPASSSRCNRDRVLSGNDGQPCDLADKLIEISPVVYNWRISTRPRPRARGGSRGAGPILPSR